MHFSCDLLDQSVERATRVVALELLDKAAKERARLDDPDDREALHDFRVAVRRLRTWLRATEPWLGDSIPKTAQRRLKRTARLTGEGRDAEVHQEWLAEQREHIHGRQRHGHERLTKRGEKAKREAFHLVTTDATRAFDRARATLSRKLQSYRVDIDDGEEDTPRSFALEMADLIRAHGTELSKCLARARSYENATEGHEARIAGKRLRYLVEVVSDCVKDGEVFVTELGELQDLLGDWHDAEVFRATIEELSEGKSEDDRHDLAPGLRVLATRLTRRGRRAFARVKRRWRDEHAFQEQVEAIVAQLSSRAGQPREIERKYLLTRLPDMPNDAAAVEIEQGYIPGKRVEERLRRVRLVGDEKRYLRTFKSGQGLARTEIEEPIPKTLFNRMWPLTRGRRVHKRRYTVADGGHHWEVDEFLDRDLVLAEVELESTDEEVVMPAWLESVVDRDVTGQSEFSNASLASATP